MCLLSSFLNIAKGWASWIKFLQLPQMIRRFVIELFKWSYDICKFDKNLKDHEISWRHDFEKRIWKAWCKSRINDFNLPKYWIQEGDVPWFRFVIELKNLEIRDFEALNSWLWKLNSELQSSKWPHDQFFIALGKGVVSMRSWSGESLSVDVNVLYFFVQ